MAQLKQTEAGLALVGDGMELVPSFESMLPRLKPGRLSGELLVKAARIKGVEHPRVLDATAGLGEDSLLLAAAGCWVTLCENDATIAALLRDAMERAAQNEELAPLVERMMLVEADSIEVMGLLADTPDVVYLDPMFPERTKSAAVKKKFQLLHHLEPPCNNAEKLLAAALATGARKVVIKRPLKGELLAGKKPSYQLKGKSIRYDVITQ